MPLLFKVQKALPGLAKFLGVESQGVLRMETSNVIQPVIEADDYLGPNQFVQLQDAAVVQNGSISITVPDKKFWRLKWAALKVDTPALVHTNAIINVVPAESGISYQLNPPYQTHITNALGLLINQSYMFGESQATGYGVDCKGVNARPGDQIQAQLVNGNGAGNNTVTLFVQFQELDL